MVVITPCLTHPDRECYGGPAKGIMNCLSRSTPCGYCHYFTDDNKNNGGVGMVRLTQEVRLKCWLVETKSYAPVTT